MKVVQGPSYVDNYKIDIATTLGSNFENNLYCSLPKSLEYGWFSNNENILNTENNSNSVFSNFCDSYFGMST